MRQAQDSEIIRLSMWVREGKPLAQFPATGSQVMIITPSQVVAGMYDWADQILCATNDKRNTINECMRQIKGFGPKPQIGDKIISLRNQWDFFSNGSNNPSPLINGTIGTIQAMDHSFIYTPHWICDKAIPVLYTTMIDGSNNQFNYIPIDYKALTTGKKFLTEKQEFQMKKSNKCSDPPFEFTYAYGITVWKAQGSEWDKILGYEESFPRDKETHQRCAYTLITRAKERLVYVVNRT